MLSVGYGVQASMYTSHIVFSSGEKTPRANTAPPTLQKAAWDTGTSRSSWHLPKKIAALCHWRNAYLFGEHRALHPGFVGLQGLGMKATSISLTAPPAPVPFATIATTGSLGENDRHWCTDVVEGPTWWSIVSVARDAFFFSLHKCILPPPAPPHDEYNCTADETSTNHL